MGGKKKGGKKKGKGKKKAADDGVAAAAQAERMTYDFDVYAAKRQIGSLQTTNKTLTHRTNELNVELEKTKAEQADVYIYLHKKLDDNFDVIASLESKIEELTTDRQRYEQAATRELATTKRTAEQTISGLQQTVEELTDKLEALTEFKEKKDEIEARLAKCLAELEAERELRQSQVAELDRRNVAAKDKLKKEMFLKIKETKQNILESTNDQLDAATKRTMAENEQMTTELQYQSKETEKLLAKNAALISENAELRREQELADATQQQLVKRTHFYQRLIKKLHERIKVAEESARRPRSPPKEAALLQDRDASITQLRHTIADLDDELKHATAEIELARSDARHAVTEHQRLVHLQDETVNFLLQAVDDVKTQISSAIASGSMTPDLMAQAPQVGAGGMPVRLDKLSGPLRERALQLLLAKMQLFQTTLWAGSGTQTTAATVAGASGTSLPPIGRGSDVLPPMSPMASGREGKQAEAGAMPPGRRASVVSVGTQTARPPASPSLHGRGPGGGGGARNAHNSARAGPHGSNPFAPPRAGPSGRRKFKASAMRGSSSLPTYPPTDGLNAGSSILSNGSAGPQRPRVRKVRPRVGIGAPPVGPGGGSSSVYSAYAYPPAASGTGFSNELSGRLSQRDVTDDLTSISVTGQRRA